MFSQIITPENFLFALDAAKNFKNIILTMTY